MHQLDGRQRNFNASFFDGVSLYYLSVQSLYCRIDHVIGLLQRYNTLMFTYCVCVRFVEQSIDMITVLNIQTPKIVSPTDQIARRRLRFVCVPELISGRRGRSFPRGLSRFYLKTRNCVDRPNLKLNISEKSRSQRRRRLKSRFLIWDVNTRHLYAHYEKRKPTRYSKDPLRQRVVNYHSSPY